MADSNKNQKTQQDTVRRATGRSSDIDSSSISKATESSIKYNKALEIEEQTQKSIQDILEKQTKSKISSALLADHEIEKANSLLQILERQLTNENYSKAQQEKILANYNAQKTGVAELNAIKAETLEKLSKEEQITYGLNKQSQDARKQLEGQREDIEHAIRGLQNANIGLDENSKEFQENRRKIAELRQQDASLESQLKGEGRLQTPTTQASIGQAINSNANSPMLKALGGILEALSSDNLSSAFKSGFDNSSTSTAIKSTSSESKDSGGSGGGGSASVLSKAADALITIASQLGDVLDSYVTNASSELERLYGPINASLQGLRSTAKNYDEIAETMNTKLGAGVLIKQTDYLSEIRELSALGISQDVETAALISVATEKTVNTFRATEPYLRRLVRMQDRAATQRFFGLEALLKRSLNAQFGDTSYLNELFDSVNGALKDAVTSLNTSNIQNEMYPFYGTTQSWLSAMYETGVEQNTISRIATTINALGSGNIQSLSQDPSMQKLLLLSMDNAGMDYANILQQGLTSSDVATLFNSMINYLKTIASNTDKNNVLEASYSNLFGISMSDMYAISKFNTNNVMRSTFSTNALENAVYQQLSEFGESRTMMSEKINNFFDNMKFTFGADIASSDLKYISWKISKLGLDIINSIEDSAAGPATKALLKLPKLGLSATMLTTAGSTLVELIPALGSQFSNIGDDKNSLTNMYSSIATSGSSSYTSSSSSATSDFKSIWNETASSAGAQSPFERNMEIDDSWKEEEKDPGLEILKQMEETLMENKGGKKAFAVSLEAMSIEVLRSFASIFADEDAMEDTFTGKNEVLKKQLFEYGDSKVTGSATSKDGEASVKSVAGDSK